MLPKGLPFVLTTWARC